MAFKELPSGTKSNKASDPITNLFRNIFNRTTAMFTAISIVLCMFESATKQNAMNPKLFWWFLLFSAVLGVISLITDYLKSKEINFIVVMITHFLLSYISFFFIFINGKLFNAYMPQATNTQNNSFFVGLVYSLAFIGAYIIIYGIKFLWYLFIDKFKNNN